MVSQFLVIGCIVPIVWYVISEMNHDDLHVHFMLSKRETYICMFVGSFGHLQKMGLVWVWDVKSNVIVPDMRDRGIVGKKASISIGR